VSVALSDFDRRLLDVVQRAVPLVPRPYERVAAELAVGEAEVIARVAALVRPGGIIREIAGVFDAAALGYATTLVAARCRPERLDEVGGIAASHPGVSHCYGRAGELNLWFTLAVPPDSRLGLERTVELLGRRIGPERLLSLPAVRRYKLNVRFDMSGEQGVASPAPTRSPASPAAAGRPKPGPGQIRAIRALQRPLPAVREPFAELAGPAGLSGNDLLVHAADFLSAGWMRRYSAVLRHRLAGAQANVLVAWDVPAERADGFAAHAVGFAGVSHCYLRAAPEGWPYSLYTMIHGRGDEEVDAVVAGIVAAAGDFPRAHFPTTHEYKKARLKLFSPELARWEAEADA